MNFVQIWQKVISLVTMATNVDSKLLTIVFQFLSGTDHSVKVSSNSESVRAGALLEFFGGYRELMLIGNLTIAFLLLLGNNQGFFCSLERTIFAPFPIEFKFFSPILNKYPNLFKKKIRFGFPFCQHTQT